MFHLRKHVDILYLSPPQTPFILIFNIFVLKLEVVDAGVKSSGLCEHKLCVAIKTIFCIYSN